MSLPIHVDAYAGHKANERPRSFTLDETAYEISTVEDQWYEPGASYFKVLTVDGKRYILRCDEANDCWTIGSAFDGKQLLARPGIRLVTVDESQIRDTLRRVEYCEQCHPEEVELPFDWVLQEVMGAGEMTDFVMAATAQCPNCAQALTGKTLVSREDD